MPHSWSAAFVITLAVGSSACLPAFAADCSGNYSAGYRVLELESGRKVAVWYPTAAAEQPVARSRAGPGFASRVAHDATPAACGRAPLVLFSHGWGGCARQSIFVTEELARHGYVVAAPDHADAVCSIDGDELNVGKLRIDRSFFDPASWNERSEIGRLQDLRAVIERVAADAQLARIADTAHVGAVGHSLGGYAVLGMAGAWPSWRTPQVKAVLAFSPYVLPFMAHGTLARLQAPVMYQGALLDLVLTTSLEGPQGAYAVTAPPRFFVKLASGTHFEWTNLACNGTPDVPACLQAQPNAALINRYAVAFLDRYLKGKRSDLLEAPGRGLAAYRFELPPSGGRAGQPRQR